MFNALLKKKNWGVNNEGKSDMMTYNKCYCVFFPSWICLAAFSKLEKPLERFYSTLCASILTINEEHTNRG